MAFERQAIDRVIRWRFEKPWMRFGQAVLVAPFAWLVTHSILVLVWLVAVFALGSLDAFLCRRFHDRPDDRRRRTHALLVLGVSMATFASIGPIMLAHRSPASLAGTALLLCAVSLNNAIMTRGWALAQRISVGAAALIMLVVTPLVCLVFDRRIGLTEALFFEAGAICYFAFLGIMMSTLNREGEALRRALEVETEQRDLLRVAREAAERARARWSMLFEQSPLPQTGFDASRLYEFLRPHVAAGETRLGDVLMAHVADVSDGLGYIDMTEANAAVERLFGITRSAREIGGGHFDAGFLASFCASLNGLDADGGFPPFEARVVRADGTPIDVEMHIRTIPDAARPWSTCIATYVDITESRRAARAQEEAVAAAEAANRAKSEFLAVMSHEIRTPLNGVLGMVQAMDGGQLSGVQRERLDVIGQSGAALLAILNDILDLSKIEAGKLGLEEADIDVGALALEVHSAFAPLAARKGLDFKVEVEPDARGIYRGDPVRLRQILNNLIANAVKFTAGGSVGVMVGAGPDGGGVRIRVTDTGVGVASDRIEGLFEKFVQADSSTTREFGGTGLGLAICRQLCAAMGGAITAESALGRGSCFTVDLPLTRLSDASPVDAPAAPAASLTGERSLRILAAEDNAVNQLVLKTLLGQAGLEPVIVENGEEAVAAWEQEDWDLILMDVQMPVMDGLTASRLIRRREAESGRAATPIIALTADAMSNRADDYRTAGMTGFVSKPIAVAQLFAAIEGAMQSRDAAAA